MPGSGELSVATVVALVLGGLAAVVLAVAVASKDAHRPKAGVAPTSVSGVPSLAPLVSAAPAPTGEIEVPAELLYPVEDSPSPNPHRGSAEQKLEPRIGF